MRIKTRILLILSMFILINSLIVYAESGAGTPYKYISSCEIDLNGDGLSDIAQLIESIRGRELIALLQTDSGYSACLISRNVPDGMFLSCHFGNLIKETEAGTGHSDLKTYKTTGTYIKLYYPEGSSIGYYWNGNKFEEVWLSD
jgi:hypothetical protein